MAAAHEEADELTLDGERLADEPARRVVPAQKAVDQALAEEAGHGLLIGQRAVGGLFAEGLPFDLPLVVAVLEVLEQDVRPLGRLGQRLAAGPGRIGLQQRE